MTDVFLTKPGYEKLIKDLAFLKKQRDELRQDLEGAQEVGGIENSVEYQDAKEKLSEVQSRIADIELKLKNAKFFDEFSIPKDTVSLGCRVTVRNEAGEEMTFTLVGEDEADPAEGRISIGAPVAHGLIGKKVGEQTKVELPAGLRVFEILKIE